MIYACAYEFLTMVIKGAVDGVHKVCFGDISVEYGSVR